MTMAVSRASALSVPSDEESDEEFHFPYFNLTRDSVDHESHVHVARIAQLPKSTATSTKSTY